MSNKLSSQRSRYLRSHATNPVDWYPWSQEALELARREDKPILLSIGYSACHWCHVMARESFEDTEIANLMNSNFVNIKVDREERPDLDNLYQRSVQLISQESGWPLTVFLTPDLKPFFGGTYFPPASNPNKPSFKSVLLAVIEAFRTNGLEIAAVSETVTDAIRTLNCTPALDTMSPEPDLKTVASKLMANFDWKNGGFKGAPKFPMPEAIALLWRMGFVLNDSDMRRAVVLTLRKMANGGIFDHLGGGFHRYAVDDSWRVPHFEKMLYDNGLLLSLYSQILLSPNGLLSIDDRKLFLTTIARTVDFTIEVLQDQGGWFYSSQDAESDGVEGAYYIWTIQDLQRLLEPYQYKAFMSVFGMRIGKDEVIPSILLNENQAALDSGFGVDEFRTALNTAISKLMHERESRTVPAKDEQLVISWNAMMISGLLWAGQAMHSAGLETTGNEATRDALRAFRTAARTLDETQKPFLDDLAFMAMAALDVSRFTNEAQALTLCRKWTKVIRDLYSDDKRAGLFITSEDSEVPMVRQKSVSDSVTPSGTAATMWCSLALAEIDGNEADKEYVGRQLRSLLEKATDEPEPFASLYNSWLLYKLGPVLVAGENARLLCKDPRVFTYASESGQKEITICVKKTCSLPFGDVVKAEAKLKKILAA